MAECPKCHHQVKVVSLKLNLKEITGRVCKNCGMKLIPKMTPGTMIPMTVPVLLFVFLTRGASLPIKAAVLFLIVVPIVLALYQICDAKGMIKFQEK